MWLGSGAAPGRTPKLREETRVHASLPAIRMTLTSLLDDIEYYSQFTYTLNIVNSCHTVVQ